MLGAALSQDPQEYSGSWNFGPDDRCHLTVAEMVERLIKFWGDGFWSDLSDPQALHEARFLKLNCDKAHAELRWHSVLSVDECLPMTAEWYKKYSSGYQVEPMYLFCLAQIHPYAEKVKVRSKHGNS